MMGKQDGLEALESLDPHAIHSFSDLLRRDEERRPLVAVDLVKHSIF